STGDCLLFCPDAPYARHWPDRHPDGGPLDERLPSEPPAGRTAVPVIAVHGALLSTQFGAAFATTLFDRVGPLGTVTVRLALAAAILCAVTRPPVRQWSRPEWRGVLALG